MHSPHRPMNAPMNVLMLTKHQLNGFGVAEVIRELSRQLTKHGVRVCCYSTDESAKTQPFGPDILCFHGPLPRPGRWWAHVRDLAPLRRVLREQHIDLIHCHNAYRPGYAARLAARRDGMPYVLTSHGELDPEADDRVSRRSVRRRCAAILRDAAAVTHLTSAMAEQMRIFASQPRHEIVIPNGVDLAWWRQGAADAPAPPPESPRVLLTISRLDEQKAVHRVVSAAAQAAQHTSLALVIAGTGPERANLMQQAQAAGMHVSESLDDAFAPAANTACFPGMVTGEAKRKLFQRSWAITLSSQRGEGFPVVLLEAMAAGRPVIAADIRAARAVLDQTGHGLVVSSANEPAAWVAAIDRLATDHALYCRLIDAAHRAAPDFDWPVVSQKYLELYRQVDAAAYA